ncbi:LysR family transcriptional regulator [Kitasatospora sp. LaBMicrA B282]|uniref:LysR family transcriptional regulator n=1 Tax=Kitasatospora sp. LaBMicrA B282 TaxID=3420949 RepID=UPI003D0EBAA3
MPTSDPHALPVGESAPVGHPGPDVRSTLDLNLLTTLDALLTEGSVAGAATRLHLSAPAVSRALGRIRKALGDPVLVRSGNQLVPTPRALALRPRVRALLEEAQALFTGDPAPDPATLRRTFSLVAHHEVVHAIGPALLTRVARAAPGVVLRFLPESSGDNAALRLGEADLEIGVIAGAGPETSVAPLVTDHQVGVVTPDHPLARGTVTLARFAAARHVVAGRRGRLRGPVDDVLAEHGLTRTVVAAAPTFAAALLLLPGTGLTTMVPERLCRSAVAALGLHSFEIPAELPPLPISQAWHRRYDSDGAHAWLREQITAAAREQLG